MKNLLSYWQKYKTHLMSFLLLFQLFIFHSELKATHAVGLDIQYECIGGNQYRLTLNLYRDCAGVTAPTAANIRVSSASCNVNATVNLALDTFFEISPLCINQLGSSTCNGGSNPGIQQYIYSGVYTFPLECPDWIISYTLCCRNNAITNLQSPGNYNIYAEARLNNTNNFCNNSPIFTTRPVPFVCGNQLFNYNHGAVDIDGDSLVYRLINPKDGPTANIPHRPSFSATNPLTTTGGFNFNTSTGQMTFTPSANQQAVVTVIVEEYRNGVLIGSTIRDMQLVVIGNCNNNPPTATGINGTNQYSIDVCAGFPLCFDIFTNDANAGQTTTLTLNNGINGATFNVSGSPFQNGRFCWTSTPADIGINNFSITVTDDACPYFASNNYTYTVNVIPNPNPPINAGPDRDICSGECVQLAGTGPPQVVRYFWTPTTGLSNPNIPNPTACPPITTTYTLNAVYSDSCVASDQVVVRVQPSPTVQVFPKTATVCAGSSIQLDGTANQPSTFSWSSGQQGVPVVVTPTANTNYVLSATNTFGCVGTDTAFITYSPPPPPQVCNNVYVTPNGTGGGLSQNDPTDLLTAIGLAQCNNLTIKMALGTYTISEALYITSLLTIEGGFDPANNWRKSSVAGGTTIIRNTANIEGLPDAPRIVALYANGASYWRMQDVTVRVLDAPAAQPGQHGVSLYGLHLTACTNYEVVRCQIITGNASNGANGEAPAGTGGAGGGGIGGAGGTGVNGCSDPTAGANGTAGSGGAAGGIGSDTGSGGTCCGSSTPAAGTSGQSGTNGTGFNPGDRPATPAPTSGFFTPTSQAASGNPGTGGGGGGGGGGSRGGTCACINCAGNPGGAGGNGGNGGLGGGGGYTGGASFAVYLYNGNTGSYIDCSINSGNAGSGGVGGAGQPGEAGGTGIQGTLSGSCVCGNPRGGDGGNGGNGGSGGRGQDGANGLSADIYSEGAVATVIVSGASQNINNGSFNVNDFNLSAQPTITVENISCTNVPVSFSTANSGNWNFGANSTPNTATGANVSSSFSTVGRKDISYNNNVYSGFYKAYIDNATFFPEITTSATRITGNEYYVCTGTPVNFSTTTPGIGFSWDMGGGAVPNTYNTANVPGVIFNTAGTYIIQLVVTTDCCGDSRPDSIILYVDQQPNIVFAGDTNICLGASTDITVSGASSYLWTPDVGNINTPTATVNLSPTTTTAYTVLGNSPLGYCNTVSGFTIVVEPLPTLNTSSTPASCSNDGTATVSAGPGTFTYVWNDPNNQTTSTATNLFTGNYSVTVTNTITGCSNSRNVFVSNDGAPVAYIQNTTDVTCYLGSDGSATAAVVSGIAPHTFSWANGVSGTDISNLPAGSYEVTVTDSRGCFSIAEAIIFQPDSLFIVVENVDSVSCFGFNDGAIQIIADGGTGGYQFLWSTTPPSNTQNINNLLAGIYNVTVTDGNGCTVSEIIEVFEPLPTLATEVIGTDPRCFGESSGSAIVNVTGGNPEYSFVWNTSPIQTTNSAVGLAQGSYSVTVVDARGCSTEDSVTLTQPAQVFVDATPDSSEIKFGESVELNSTYTNAVGTPTYIWEPSAGLSCSQCSNPVASPEETTVYGLTIIDENGCVATDRVIVAVNYIKVLYVPNAFTPNNDGINDKFLVFTDGAKSILFRVFNRWGEKIFETTALGEGWDGTYLGKQMNPGVYVYYVEATYQDDNIKVEKGSVTLVR